jgi:aldehyde:ferredoxin oxidoreductase
MSYGATGFDLEVDLTRGNIEKFKTDPGVTALHLGGQGAAARLLWDRVPPEVEPDSPRNLLIFSAGPLVGTPVPGANHTTVSTISPQSNFHVSSGFEGFFGPELKQAGYDNLVIRGKSPELVYLWIHNDRVEIREAGHLQGKSPLETAALIQQELGDPGIQVAAIGLAGENRVCQASIGHANSAASRGVGVVMGDKGLKAIAIRGTRDLKLARPAELFPLCNRQYRDIYDNPHCGDLLLSEDDASWHVKNLPWRDAKKRVKAFGSEELEAQWALRVETDQVTMQWENYSQEYEEVHETVVETSELLRGTGCYNCPKECHKAFSLPGGRKYFMKSFTKLAYAMAAYATLPLNYDVLFAMQEYGLDEFAMPPVFAFVLELYDSGRLSDAELPDFPADGSGRFLYLVDKVARREGLGALLADGLDQAARQLGDGAEAGVRSVKKFAQLPLELKEAHYPAYLMYAAGDKPDITQSEGSFPQLPLPSKKARSAFVKQWDAAPERFKQWFLAWEPGRQLPVEAAVEIADWNESMHYADDALGICPLLSSFRGQFGGRPPYHQGNLPELYTLATGATLDAERLLEISRRNRQLVRAINIRRGLQRADETAPQGLWPDPDPEVERRHLEAYYAFKGWTPEGVPSRATLERLGLQEVSEDFLARGIVSDNQAASSEEGSP